jgi:hypothetical protein
VGGTVNGSQVADLVGSKNVSEKSDSSSALNRKLTQFRVEHGFYLQDFAMDIVNPVSKFYPPGEGDIKMKSYISHGTQLFTREPV